MIGRTKKRILVTGANGLLGNQILKSLYSSYEIHATVYKEPEIRFPDVIYHFVDLSSNWNISLLPENIDTIFHLAQSSRFRDFPGEAMDVFRVNTDSTARLLDYAHRRGVKRFVYASSGGVYGAGNQAFHENSPIVPHDKLGYYLGSKLCSEILVENYSQVMTVLVLRFFFMYGPRQKRSMLIPRLIDSIQEGRPIILNGENGLSLNPIHVNDAAVALTKTLDIEESCTINIAGPETFSLREISNIIGEKLSKLPVLEVRNGDTQNLVADIEAMKRYLCIPQISLRTGVAELL